MEQFSIVLGKESESVTIHSARGNNIDQETIACQNKFIFLVSFGPQFLGSITVNLCQKNVIVGSIYSYHCLSNVYFKFIKQMDNITHGSRCS